MNRKGKKRSSFVAQFVILMALLFFLEGCSEAALSTPTAEITAVPSPVIAAPAAASPVPVPTLVPTFTPLPGAAAGPTTAPLPTPTLRPDLPTGTSISFDETVVTLHYTIPRLGLDRRLEGNVSSHIVVVDEAQSPPFAVQLNNRASVLLDLQQVLPGMELAPPPEGCEGCVRLRYELPLEDEAGEGWLQDTVLLASVENFMAVAVGPHFPPDTIVGLRRSASAYAPAHTVALTADGRLWTWLAIEAEVGEPLPPEAVDAALPTLLAELPIADLSSAYVANCPTVARETLWLNPPAAAEGRQIDIVCPEYTLPTTLLPLYLALDAAVAPKLAELEGPPRPPSRLPLTALLDYRREDNTRLTLHYDGQSVAIDSQGTVYTSTLGVSQVVSLTTNLLNSGEIRPGLTTFQRDETEPVTTTVVATATPAASSVLLVRGLYGVFDGEWTGVRSVPALNELNALLDSLIGAGTAPAETPSATETPTGDETPVATPTLAQTTVPSATPPATNEP